MPSTHVGSVGFIGGPFDGYVQPVQLGRDELREIVTIPVNGNVIAKLTGGGRPDKSPATSVSVYMLKPSNTSVEYIYVGPMLPTNPQMASWRG
ncbi:MAG: hypothetical protein RJP95_04915 [Pirellulales bacterium]